MRHGMRVRDRTGDGYLDVTEYRGLLTESANSTNDAMAPLVDVTGTFLAR